MNDKQTDQLDIVTYGEYSERKWIYDLPVERAKELLDNMRRNTFNDILHFFYKEGLSLEDMAAILAAKAKRHGSFGEVALGYHVDKAIEETHNSEKRQEQRIMETMRAANNFTYKKG
jgi:hypothetical protein